MDFYQIKAWPVQKTDFGKAYSNEKDAVQALLNHWAYDTGSIHHSLVNASVDIVESKDVPEFPIGMVLLSHLDKSAYACKRYELYSEGLGFNDTWNIAPKEAMKIIDTDESSWFTAKSFIYTLDSRIEIGSLEYWVCLAKAKAIPYVFHKGSEPILLSWYPIDQSMSVNQIKDGIIPHQKKMLKLYQELREEKIKNAPYVYDHDSNGTKNTRTIIGCKISCTKSDPKKWDGFTPLDISIVNPEKPYNLNQDGDCKSKEILTYTLNFKNMADTDFPFSRTVEDHNGYPVAHFFYLEGPDFNLDFFSKGEKQAMALEKFNLYNNTGISDKWRQII